MTEYKKAAPKLFKNPCNMWRHPESEEAQEEYTIENYLAAALSNLELTTSCSVGDFKLNNIIYLKEVAHYIRKAWDLVPDEPTIDQMVDALKSQYGKVDAINAQGDK